MNQIHDIIADIKRENCVVIIGPDIVDYGEKSFFEVMCDEFIEDAGHKNIIDTSPQYIFANEELFQLMPTAKETTLLRMMEGFYQKATVLDLPLTKISQIPFHLIISLMPDDRLQRIFTSQNLNCSYGHYPREGAHAPIEKPSREKPLIYNLLGDFNELDAIITFDHLFTFLSGIMGKRELPQSIQETLKKARTFVFLGVHFEKWYVQLLLRIITSKDKK
ncbi:MAG TPA: SIR2 family protein, partial [Niabella sp.]|nr:SIR2 family protein [Niabella sp.]